jgi:hypothetical protein
VNSQFVNLGGATVAGRSFLLLRHFLRPVGRKAHLAERIEQRVERFDRVANPLCSRFESTLRDSELKTAILKLPRANSRGTIAINRQNAM